MSTLSTPTITTLLLYSTSISLKLPHYPTTQPSLLAKSPSCPHPFLSSFPRRRCGSLTAVSCKSPEAEGEASSSPKPPEDEWLMKLPDKKKPLYSHSLPCIEAWLRDLGFFQTKDDRAVWLVQKPEWHAQLSLDITELYIRYLKTGPGHLEKDVERRFSYALSREDIENAILGGP